MSTPSQLEELRNKKVELQEEAHQLEEKERSMDERVKVLEEKIAIAELERNIRLRNEAIVKLESKMGELEQKLDDVVNVPREEKPLEEIPQQKEIAPEETPEPAEETAEEVTEEIAEEPTEEVVTVTELESPIAEEEPSESFAKQHEKKKRKFF